MKYKNCPSTCRCLEKCIFIKATNLGTYTTLAEPSISIDDAYDPDEASVLSSVAAGINRIVDNARKFGCCGPFYGGFRY